MSPKEIEKLIKLKKSQIKKLGLVKDLNQLFFGSNHALHDLLWNKNRNANLAHKASLQERLAMESITPKVIPHKTAQMPAMEIDLGPIQLAYALYTKEAHGSQYYFSAKSTSFYLWANGELVLTLGTKTTKGAARTQITDECVKRFKEGPWIDAIQQLAQRMKHLESKEQHKLQEENSLMYFHGLMENFGIDQVDLAQLKAAQTNKTPLSLLKWFSRNGTVQ